MFSPLAELLPDLRDLYQDLHRHPELSFAESRTAGELGHHLRDLGYEVTTGVGPAPAGRVLSRPGLMMAASDSLRVRLFGRGGHAAKPESTVDTVVMAAATVLRLQTVVSREIPATESAVVTVGALQAGTKENIIPEEAELKLSVRTFDPVVNDDAATKRVSEAFIARFGAERVVAAQAQTGSEDFGVYGVRGGFPSVFWFVGGSDPQTYARAERVGRVDRDIPTNHSPHFAPVLEPTLSTGVETLVVAAMAWLSPGGGVDDA